MPGKAIVLGASGLIGSNLVRVLIRDKIFDEVILLVRKKLDISSSIVRQKIINFDLIEEYQDELYGNVIFSCLGTTRSQVADYQEYRNIDVNYPKKIAEVAAKHGVEQFHVISSMGANKNSFSSYLKLKGELEEALKNIPFKSLHIYRPSFITGERVKKRISDYIVTPLMKFINPVLSGSLKKYRSIEASVIANAMIKKASENLTGIFIYESDQIQDIK
ncbi:MAG TPA: NAD-dependent epimerase/dehydratase family protein [Sphingobacteriaceae bacterium]